MNAGRELDALDLQEAISVGLAPSDTIDQAERFLAMFRRLRGQLNIETEFRQWAATKDFSPRDRLTIACEVRRLLPVGKAAGEERQEGVLLAGERSK